jgi:TRAP-type C4-dicarboxylate transport system permease small subunit
VRRAASSREWWAPPLRAIRALSTLAVWVAAISLVAMMFADAVDILGTKLFNRPLAGASEATETLMVLVVFLALSGAQVHREHVVVDLLTTRLRATTQLRLDALAQALMAAFFALLAWQAWRLGLASYALRETAAGIVPFPVYPSKIALAVGATLAALQALADLLASLLSASREGRA